MHRSGHQPMPIWAKCHTLNFALVRFQARSFLFARIIDAYRLIIRTRSEKASVGAEGETIDRSGMCLYMPYLLLICSVPCTNSPFLIC